jgi:nucleotide-binding universal stress UspA family protein
VAVDFGDASDRALQVGGVVAAAFGARLRAIHAERFEPPPYFTMEQIERLESERQMAQSAANEHLARHAAKVSMQPTESIVLDEPPVEAILDAAAAADLIVVGTHGRRGPGRWWLGSVAERVVRAATIPVLVTRAATTAPGTVFDRVVLVHDGHDGREEARSCAERLAGIAGGSLVEAGPVAQCDVNVIHQATLVVMAARTDRPSWGVSDPVTRVLGGCQQPVLFIPVR